MILTGKKLEEIGFCLYGRDWPSTLARYLRVNRKSVFRWREGGRKPKDLKTQLLALAEDRLAEMAQTLEELREIDREAL